MSTNLTIGHYATHPLNALPTPPPRVIDVTPVIAELKTALRKIAATDDFETGKRAGIRRALEMLKNYHG